MWPLVKPALQREEETLLQVRNPNSCYSPSSCLAKGNPFIPRGHGLKPSGSSPAESMVPALKGQVSPAAAAAAAYREKRSLLKTFMTVLGSLLKELAPLLVVQPLLVTLVHRPVQLASFGFLLKRQNLGSLSQPYWTRIVPYQGLSIGFCCLQVIQRWPLLPLASVSRHPDCCVV